MYKQIVNMTFLPVFENKDALIKALLIPLMIIIVLTKLSIIFQEDATINIAVTFIIFLLNVVIAITTHRILILGQNSVPLWGLRNFTKREFSFMIKSILIALIMGACVGFGIAGLAMKLPDMIGIPLMLGCSTAALIFFSRLSLVLPSIAINEPITFSQAWEATKNYKSLTFFTIVFFPIAITLVVGIIYTLVIKFLMGLISPHLDILFPVLDVFLTVFVVSALSATYQFIKEKEPAQFANTTPLYQEPTFENNTIEENVVAETPEIETNSEIIIDVNGEEFTVNLDEFPITFDSIKTELQRQYENEGLTKIEVDTTDTWIAKHPENDETYVALQANPEGFNIETMNVKEVDLNEGMREKKEE